MRILIAELQLNISVIGHSLLNVHVRTASQISTRVLAVKMITKTHISSSP